jgi:hypothetical protein
MEIPTSSAPVPESSSSTCTSSAGLGNGKGCSKVASMTLKIAVVAPMPRAIVAIAIRENPGVLSSMRTA